MDFPAATGMRVCRALVALCVSLCVAEDGQTDVTTLLNYMISYGTSGTYTGGRGVLVRVPDDMSGSNQVVVPASFWSNDLQGPSQLYPNGNPFCPHGQSDGYADLSWSTCNGDGGDNGPWDYAIVGIVVGSALHNYFYDFDNMESDTWGWGVFYASDANSCDARCRYLPDSSGWDCPGAWVAQDGTVSSDSSKMGAGYFPAGNPLSNPEAGGGAGCHFDKNTMRIDQADAAASNGQDLVGDPHCQCNYIFNDDWGHWVDTWIANNKQKPGFEWRSWFGNGKAPQWGLDTTICWVNNPRDLIGLQNNLYWKRLEWNNQKVPISNWGGGTAQDRIYWGWNEVPITRAFVDYPGNWDSLIIKLPADLCQNGDFGTYDTPDCLSKSAQYALEKNLESMEGDAFFVPGVDQISSRPGSYIVFVREHSYSANPGVWQRYFFCYDWNSPSGVYDIIFIPMSSSSSTGACYISKN